MSYKNLKNKDSEKINNQEKEQYPIDEINKILDRGNDFWKHLSEFVYSHQISLAKNYQWLCVSIFTGLAAIYSEFLRPIDLLIPQPPVVFFGLTSFIISCCLSLAGLTLGIVMLSSGWFWFTKTVGAPLQVDKCESIIERVKNSGVKSSTYYENLKIWASWYDASNTSYIKLINQRGKLLRAQCYLTLGALITGFLSLILFVIVN